MYKDKTFLAIIPARGGSKRVPNKNILNLAGKSLISWSIEAAKKSKYIDDIVVSSDSDKILNIARKYSDIITIKRPDELATDIASSIDVIEHAIKYLNKNYDYIILLQPTSPLRNEKHIDEAIELLMEKNGDAVISVCEIDHPVEWCNILPENLSMENFILKDNLNKRSQDLPKRYRINGAIYICKTERFLKEKTFFINDNIYAYIMDRKDSIDIDEEIDFKMAEFLIRENWW